ncbi:hypothetical protein HAX54_031691, partial [Datura stramonium]|nr:hypothetical protein [Datura stramonium]
MPKFKHLKKKQTPDQSISTSQGTESISRLPIHPITSFLATTHLAPSFQPTSQAPPAFQPTSRSPQSIKSTSHPTPMDQTASHPTPMDQMTSRPALTEHDSSKQAPIVQAALKKRSSRESMTHWIVDAI